VSWHIPALEKVCLWIRIRLLVIFEKVIHIKKSNNFFYFWWIFLFIFSNILTYLLFHSIIYLSTVNDNGVIETWKVTSKMKQNYSLKATCIVKWREYYLVIFMKWWIGDIKYLLIILKTTVKMIDINTQNSFI